MRVSILPSAFHPSLGGVEELTRQLAHAHRRAGHEVTIVTERWPRDLPEAEDHEGLPVRRFPMRVPAGSLRSNVSYRLTTRAVQAKVNQAVKAFGANVLHVQCVSSTTLYALGAKRALGLPLVVTLQGELTMDAAGIFQRPGIAQTIMQRALAEADMVTGCSKQVLDEAEAFYVERGGQPFGERGRVIHNGIRLADFEGVEPHRHPRPYILAIGRHVRQKGFDVLLEAFAKADQPGGALGHDLLLAGDGEERTRLEGLARELGLEGRVEFVGRVDRLTAAALFKGCTFFVLSSRHEPFGIVNLEAMAAGKAVLATRVGGVSEFLNNGETGLLVQGENVEAMAVAIERLASDQALRERLGALGAKHVCRFEWDELASQYSEVYAVAKERSAAVSRA